MTPLMWLAIGGTIVMAGLFWLAVLLGWLQRFKQ
jgi:hypothetical protein